MNRRDFLNKVIVGSAIAASGVPVLAMVEEEKPLTMLDRVGIRRLVVEIKKFVQKVCEDAMDSGGFKTYHYSAIRKYLDALVVRKAMKRYGLYQFYNSFVDREVKSSLTIFIYPTDDVKYIEINFEMNRTESVV